MSLVVEPGGEEASLQEGDFFTFTREPIELPQLITTIVERAERNAARPDDTQQNNRSHP